MKRGLALAAAFGAGFGVVVIVSVGILSYWSKRPTPWNRDAVTARFDSVDTEGPEHKLVFLYVLTNNTYKDLRIDSDAEVWLAPSLERQAALAGGSQDLLMVDLPLFIPAKQRTRVAVHFTAYTYGGTTTLSEGSSRDERERDQKAIAAFVRDDLPNLNGFVLFHHPSHYEIELPSGWKKQQSSRPHGS